ncbi:MAG: glycosyltransferase family 4 protein [Caldilineaceae bacterium SB0668_bin_21]|nr:glycosyltransferase family 4 protein [Caldilineaceae bacterium SB0668_bin_21]MYC22286.1 glycosyltransferase family 4 protein [Caldilineaceae bacterium SB0662_bin_25]
MKIAVLSSQLPSLDRAKTGGVAYAAHRLSNALAQRDHKVTVFTTDQRPADACYLVRRVFPERPRNPYRAWLWQWQLAWSYGAQDFSEFDIIHVHDNCFFVRRPGIPVVRTLHGAAMAEAIHATTWKRRLWYLTVMPCELWEATKASRVVAVSANTRKYAPRIKHVIPNSVNQRVFFPEPNLNDDVRHRDPVILFVGTLAGRKRGHMLLELFQSQIRPALPKAELWMVAEKTVQAPGVVYFENPNEDSLADLYRRSWVFCLPSTYEGFGIPYAEAMACGTPVVATPNAGARELLEDGKWGVLAQPTELGSELLSLLNDQPRRHSLALRGLERAQAFAQDRVVDAYESLFASTDDSECQRN